MKFATFFTGGITPGTVRANKVVTADADKDVSGIRNLDMSGNLSTSGNVSIDGTLAAATINVGGGAMGALAGNLSVSVSQIGSSATNTTQTLKTYSMPANTLNTNNHGVKVVAWGTFAGNAAPKTMQLNIGGASINAGSVTQSGSTWLFEGLAYRVAANSQRILFKQNVGGVVVVPKATSDTSVDTDTITISVQGLDASAGQSNILCDGLIVELFQAP